MMANANTSNFFTPLNPKTKSLDKGEHLFSQNDAVSNIYLINSGRVKLVRSTIDGVSVLLHIGTENETIAEASLFSTQYHCSAVADSVCEVSFVKKKDVLQFLEDKPEEMMKLLSIYARQIRDLRSVNEIKNIRSAKERILNYILSSVDENRVMKLDSTLKDIAQKIGLAHETFYRELKLLEKSGQITRSTNMITLISAS